MKSAKYLGSFIGVALILCASTFAKDVNSGKFDLTQVAHIGSTVLQPGHYKAEWTGPNNALTVSIVEDGKTVATTNGNIKDLPGKAPYGAVIINIRSQRVDEIDFHNRSEALVFPGV